MEIQVRKEICDMDIKDLTSWGLTEAIFNVIENGFYADEETGEVFFTSDDLDALEEKLDDKLNGICGYIKRSEASAEMLKNRKKEIEDSIKFYENRADRLSEFLKSLMLANNIDKRELKDYRLGTRKTSSVNITDENAVYRFLEEHPEYNETCKNVETKTSLIKKGLKEVLANENIPGAQIVEGKKLNVIVQSQFVKFVKLMV